MGFELVPKKFERLTTLSICVLRYPYGKRLILGSRLIDVTIRTSNIWDSVSELGPLVFEIRRPNWDQS